MSNTVFGIIMHALVLLTAFPVHEFAHAYVAHKMGDDTAKYQGRMTINPFAHLDFMGTIMMILVGFGWGKPVPINPNNFKNRKVGMALSSLAGPVSNLIMAYIAMIFYKLIYFYAPYSATMQSIFTMFGYLVTLNIGLAVFNLLPIPPLDGSRIFTLFLKEETYFNIMRYERYIFLILIVISYSGLLDTPLYYLKSGVLDIMDVLTFFIGRLYS
jgi:Zn-dependent protease